MPLILKSLDDDEVERRIEDGKTFTLGRGTDNDLVLVDPSREVSKTHCRIEADGARFVLVDLSINGVVIDGQGAPMGPGARHTLASGDVFIVGRRRFAVTIADTATPDSTEVIGPVASLAPTAPKSISHILDGVSEGPESRASGGVAGEAQRWLGTLPEGSAEETMREPMGWDGPPPADDPAILPADFDQPASDFANRSEHTPAAMGAMHVPRPQQLIPTNWHDDDAAVAPAAPAARASMPAAAGGTPSASLRRAFAEGGRVDPAGLSGVSDEELMRRCGEALRAFLDGLDSIEAAQAVAERDCALPSPAEGALWTDFFATNRDPLLSLLAEQHPGPSRALAQRAAALADRQRALGHAVADAAHRYDGALAPAVIEAEAKGRFARGPLAKVANWARYVDLHAELAATAPGETLPSFLVLLRKSFARAMTKRP